MNITWDDIFDRLRPYDKSGAKIYGVPRGGMIATAFLKSAVPVHHPDLATMILDDILDSGRTLKRFQDSHPTKPFYVLIDKKKEGIHEWVRLPWEASGGPEDAVVRLLQYVGEDPERDGLLETPSRVLKSFKELTEGYTQDPSTILSKTFEASYNELVVLEGIRLTSLCEHHLLPFAGTATVGYIPNGRVVGISKLARLVECFARRLQIQERMTEQIAKAIEDSLHPLGVGVIVKAHHQCMGCRGVRQPDTVMKTCCLRGVFLEESSARAEFMSLR